jgi:hypothetical protein
LGSDNGDAITPKCAIKSTWSVLSEKPDIQVHIVYLHHGVELGHGDLLGALHGHRHLLLVLRARGGQ